MTIRTRLRHWLRVETDIAAFLKIQEAQTKRIDDLRSEHDGLCASVGNTARGLRELIDGVSASVDRCREGGVQMCLGLSDRLQRAEDCIKSASVFLGEQSKINESTIAEAKRLNSVLGQEHNIFEERLVEVKAVINEHVVTLHDILEQSVGYYDRIVALETASKSLGSHLALIAASARDAERKRCALLVETATMPHFRREHRETLAGLIRSGK